MHPTRLLALTSVVFLTTAAPVAAQSDAAAAQAGVMAALMDDLATAERKLVSLAEAIPVEAYAWRPGEGVRSVSQVVMHVAADNYFIPIAVGAEPPAGTGIRGDSFATLRAYQDREVTKEEALVELRASFDHLREVMAGVDEAKLV